MDQEAEHRYVAARNRMLEAKAEMMEIQRGHLRASEDHEKKGQGVIQSILNEPSGSSYPSGPKDSASFVEMKTSDLRRMEAAWQAEIKAYKAQAEQAQNETKVAVAAVTLSIIRSTLEELHGGEGPELSAGWVSVIRTLMDICERTTSYLADK